MKNLKFGVVTDTHFGGKFENRLDNSNETALKKLNEAYDFFEKEKCEFVIHLGDMFDKQKIKDFELVAKIRDVLKAYKLKTYIILGQHDLAGYNHDSYSESNLFYLCWFCDGQIELIKDSLIMPKCNIFACHVGIDPIDFCSTVERKNELPNIVLSHSLIYDKPSAFKIVSVNDIAKKSQNVDLVLSGDLHCGFQKIKKENTVFYNPGSMIRTSRELVKSQVASVELIPFFNSWEVEIFEKQLTKQPNESCFTKQEESIQINELAQLEASEIKQVDKNQFINVLSSIKTKKQDIFTMIEQESINQDVDKKITSFILSFKEKIEIPT